MPFSVIGNGFFAVSSIAIAFIAASNKRNIQNLTFAIFNICLAIWAIVLILFDHPLIGSPELWIKINYLDGHNLTFLLFLYIWFFDRPWPGKLNIVLYVFGVSYLFFFWTLFFTDSFIVQIIHHDWGNQAVLGLAYWVMVIFSSLMVGWSIYILVNKYRLSKGITKLRLKYFFIGLSSWLIVVSTTNLFMPLFQNFRFIWIGPLTGNIFSAIVIYSIARYRLLDLKQVFHRGIAFSLLLLTIMIFYTGIIIVIQGVVFHSTYRLFDFSILTATIVILLTYEPIKSFTEKITSSLFFKTRYDIQQTILALNKSTTGISTTSTLIEAYLLALDSTLRPQGICLYLPPGPESSSNKHIYALHWESIPIKQLTILFARLRDEQISSVLLTEEIAQKDDVSSRLAHKSLLAILTNLDLEAVIPLIHQQEWLGLILLTKKKSQDPYNSNDIHLLELVAHQAAISIQNALLFENLEYRVSLRTADLEMANKHLMSLDKAKTEFLSIASHQLRTPLSAIRGYLSLLSDGDYGSLTDQQNTVVQKSADNVTRLVSLVNDLLSLARIEAGTGPKGLNLAIIDFRTMIDQVVEELAMKAKNKGLELNWMRPTEKIEVALDKEKMSQVVLNLIDNALNYTKQGSVKVELKDQETAILFSVKDTGIGIAKDELDNMFKKFYRTQDAVKVKPDGSGIGLYISKTIIEAHNGSVAIESMIDDGSTFNVTIPKTCSKTTPTEATQAA